MADEDVTEFALTALEHAARSVVPEGGPLIPFVMLKSPDGNVGLHRFVAELAAAQAHARDYVRQAEGVAEAAVAWDGYLTSAKARTDAVFVEASREGLQSMIFAQRYRRVGLLRRTWQIVEGPVLVGRGNPLF